MRDTTFHGRSFPTVILIDGVYVAIEAHTITVENDLEEADSLLYPPGPIQYRVKGSPKVTIHGVLLEPPRKARPDELPDPPEQLPEANHG